MGSRVAAVCALSWSLSPVHIICSPTGISHFSFSTLKHPTPAPAHLWPTCPLTLLNTPTLVSLFQGSPPPKRITFTLHCAAIAGGRCGELANNRHNYWLNFRQWPTRAPFSAKLVRIQRGTTLPAWPSRSARMRLPICAAARFWMTDN
jgi:hypothetical protein